MLVKDLDGKEYRLDTRGCFGGREECSSYHEHARKILKGKFPTFILLEEVPVTIKKGKTEYLDFFIPLKRMIIEVHGEQHYTFNKHFHVNQSGWVGQLRRDRLKREWAELNNLIFVELKYNEKDKWEDIINGNS